MKKQLQRLLSCALLIAVLFSALPGAAAAAPVFSDVPAGSWAAGDISRAVEKGLFRGETATRFGMGHKMTRAAFVVVLCRMFGWEMVTPETPTYADVQDQTLWYAGAVEAAYAHGAITRQTDTFRPREAITREELTVMLMRALGYGTIAGLAQDLPMPFTDVETGGGYLSMAYELGIVSGTSATTFSPDRAATREQAAVMLMRLYDRSHAAAPALTGVAVPGASAGDWTGFAAVAVSGGRLSSGGQVAMPDAAQAEALQSAIRSGGASALLYVTGAASALRGDLSAAAAALAAAVTDGGYDGLYLDLPRLADDQREKLTGLTAALRTALGQRLLLYVVAEAPAWQGRRYDAYDYAALAAAADRLVLRVAAYEPEGDGFPIAPLEPLEEVYYALAELKGTVPADKLCLLVTTTGTAWKGGKQSTLPRETLQQLADETATARYYSSRYACAYLAHTERKITTVAWYLDGQAAAERARMAGFFGVKELCLSDLGSLSPELLAGLGR